MNKDCRIKNYLQKKIKLVLYFPGLLFYMLGTKEHLTRRELLKIGARGLLKSEGKNTDGKHIILLPFFQLGGWQIQAGNLNKDGYNLDPDLYPQTGETFNQYAKMFGKAKTAL